MSVPLASTKHYRLAQAMRQELRRMAPGQQIQTLQSLKARFGASQATVDRAITRLRREGLIYRPAGEKRLVVAEVCDPAAKRVTLIRPDWPSQVTDEILRAVVIAGRAHDWAFEYAHYRSHQGLDLARAIGENDAAVLVTTNEPLPPHLLAALRRPRRPVVLVQDQYPGLSLPTVLTDDRRVAEIVVEHLGALGHRRILLVLPTQTTAPMREMAAGWRAAMQRLGQDNLDELLLDAAVPPFEYSLTWTYEYLKRWMQRGGVPFTAALGGTGEVIMALSRVLRESKLRVPEDVSLAGSAVIIEWAPFLNPPLTGCSVDMAGYGRAVVQMLEDRFGNPSAPAREIRIEPTLHVRETTAPPKENGV